MQKIVLSAVSVLSFLLLTSCGSVPVNYEDGFRENKSSAGVYTVEFTGNGNSKPESVEKALNRRCAELTLKEGFDQFTFYTKSRSDKATWGSGVTVPRYYGVIHMHKGTVPGGLDAKAIMAESLPEDIKN
ncbi:CC0125/CC1285 family lipoprotein [Bdellovibrio sp. HCB209]|uniref:CC0125/CC1285 family lipoprotein n=1 Tax=Bdellovibrio sp. HCB209 TaxID=3394354 RepID=UPI0039B5BA80